MIPRLSIPRRRIRNSELELLEARIAPASMMYHVTNLNDTGGGSLRAAISQANANPGADMIDFQITGMITLMTGELAITDDLMITGPGAGMVTVDGGGEQRVFHVFDTDSITKSVSISGLTITKGYANGDGGAILNQNETLSLDGVVVSQSTSTGNGGGVASFGANSTLTISSSTITGNHGSSGGGIYVDATDSNAAQGFSLTLSTVSTNNADSAGGGIFINNASAPILIATSTLDGNHASEKGGGLAVASTSGGGTNSSFTTIDSTTVSNNTAGTNGGGINFDSLNDPILIVNSTISGNSAGSSARGGGLFVQNFPVTKFSIDNSTIANNQAGTGGGIASGSSNFTFLVSTIVAKNTGNGVPSLASAEDDLTGLYDSTRSLILSENGAFVFDVGGTITGQDPQLLALGNYGGPTQTQKIQDTSPAIDQGTAADTVLFDQRGEGFDRSIGLGVDIGAYESSVAPTTVDLSLTMTKTPQASYAPGDTLTYAIVVKNNGTGSADQVTISDAEVPGLVFMSSDNTGWTHANGTYTYDVGTLAGGASSASIPLVLHVPASVGVGVESVQNSATAGYGDMGSGVDSDPSNNTDSITDTITADAILHVSIDDDITKTVPRNGTITYTISYSNTGNQDANVSLVDQVPGNTFGFDSTDNWKFNFSDLRYHLDLGTLAANSSGTKTFSIGVGNTFPTSQLTLTDSVDITYTPGGGSSGVDETETSASVDTLLYQGIEVLTPGVAKTGQHGPSKVRIIDLALKKAGRDDAEIDFMAYGKSVRDSFRTAVFDFNGDGFDDLIILPEHGTAAVKVFDGTTGKLMESPLNGLRPFGPTTGGFVEVISQPAVEEAPPIVTVYFGSSLSGGMVKAYDADTGMQVGATLFPFQSIDKHYKGGVRLATGDVDGDGVADLIAAQGNFGHTVNVYSDGDLTNLLGSFTTPGNYKGGFNVGAGDLNGDGRAEILLGHNRLSAPTVEIWSYDPPRGLADTGTSPFVFDTSFTAFADKYLNGVRPSVGDYDLDGRQDIIVATGYAGKSAASVFSLGKEKLVAGITVNTEPIDTFKAFPSLPLPGVWVSISDPLNPPPRE